MAAIAERGNLESRAQDVQMRIGIIALAISLLIGTLLAQSGFAREVRLAAFAPFFVASYGLLAALYRTCGLTAIAGRRITSDGSEPVADRAELLRLRARGLRVMCASAV